MLDAHSTVWMARVRSRPFGPVLRIYALVDFLAHVGANAIGSFLDMNNVNRKRKAGRRGAAPRPKRVANAAPRARSVTRRVFLDANGEPFRRFYKLDTLFNALETQAQIRGSLLLTTVQQTLGSSALSSLTFDLVHENTYRYVFVLRVSNTKRKRCSFRFIAAKNPSEHSVAVQSEFDTLSKLHARAPRCVLRPLRAGTLQFADHKGRAPSNREIFAYFTEPARGFRELVLDARGLFSLGVDSPTPLSPRDTQSVKRRIVEIVVRSYNPRSRECMGMPNLPGGHVVASCTKGRAPQVKISGASRPLSRMTPARILDSLLRASWPHRGRTVPLVPDDPAEIAQALANALGKEGAATWLKQYANAVSRGGLRSSGLLPLEAIAELT